MNQSGLKKISYMLIIATLMYGCTDHQNSKSKQIYALQKEDPFHEEEIIEEVEEKLEWNDLMKRANFPEGLVIGEYFASNEYEFYFGKNGVVVMKPIRGYLNFLMGKWKRNGDTLSIQYEKELSIKGIGDPIPHPEVVPGNYIEEYERYDTAVTYADERYQMSFAEITSFMNDERSFNPYEVLSFSEHISLERFLQMLEKYGDTLQ